MDPSDQELKSSGVIRSACQAFARTEKTEADWVLVHAWAIREFPQFSAAAHENVVRLAKIAYANACDYCNSGPTQPGTQRRQTQLPDALKG